MKLYLLRRDESRFYADETISCVVAAPDKHTARYIAHAEFDGERLDIFGDWKSPSTQVTEIGTATEFVTEGVIHSHYKGSGS